MIRVKDATGSTDYVQIHCFLPSSEDAYRLGMEEPNITLQQALTTANPSSLNPFAAAISLTAETGHKLKLLQQNDFTAPSSSPSGNIWQKINFLNDTLHYAFSIPPHLAASGFKHTPMLTFLHMAAASSTISLHEAAEEMASAHGITPSSLLESQELRLAAAEMIASTMRLASHADTRTLHPFTGACLFSASRVFMRSLRIRPDAIRQESLRVLLVSMAKLQANNSSTGGYFKELEKEFPGMRQSLFNVDDTTQSPSRVTLPKRSSMSGSPQRNDYFNTNASDHSIYEPPSRESYTHEHHTTLQKCEIPTTQPMSLSSSFVASPQNEHILQQLYSEWDSLSQIESFAMMAADYQRLKSVGATPQITTVTRELPQQQRMVFAEGEFYTA